MIFAAAAAAVYVKILHDQWFLATSDPSWKEEVKTVLEGMALVPPKVRAEFERTVDWLKDWACTRRVVDSGRNCPGTRPG